MKKWLKDRLRLVILGTKKAKLHFHQKLKHWEGSIYHRLTLKIVAYCFIFLFFCCNLFLALNIYIPDTRKADSFLFNESQSYAFQKIGEEPDLLIRKRIPSRKTKKTVRSGKRISNFSKDYNSYTVEPSRKSQVYESYTYYGGLAVEIQEFVKDNLEEGTVSYEMAYGAWDLYHSYKNKIVSSGTDGGTVAPYGSSLENASYLSQDSMVFKSPYVSAKPIGKSSLLVIFIRFLMKIVYFLLTREGIITSSFLLLLIWSVSILITFNPKQANAVTFPKRTADK